MENVFINVSYEELKCIYEEILKAREDGLRPRILDPYIREVRDVYPLDKGEGWRYTEQLFWEEIARRYFEE